MPVTIELPDFQAPDTFTINTVRPHEWDRDSLSRLAFTLGVDADFQAAGLWHLARTDRQLLEAYDATPSLRLANDIHLEQEQMFDVGLDEAKAMDLGTSLFSDLLAVRADLVPVGVTDSVVLVSEGPRRRPKRFITGTQVSFDYQVDGIGFVGPGAKAQATYDPDGNLIGCYRMWRDFGDPLTALRARSRDELAALFGESAMFRRLSDDTAKVSIDRVTVGRYVLPPTHIQEVFYPAVQIQGRITTEQTEDLGFCTWVSAVDPKAMPRGRRQPVRPTSLIA